MARSTASRTARPRRARWSRPGRRPGTAPGSPATGSVADTRKPGLRVTVTGRRSLASRRRLRVAVRSDELATVRAGGRLRGVARFRDRAPPPGGEPPHGADRADLPQGGPEAAAHPAPQAGRGRLTILARDAAGNQRRVTRRIVVKRAPLAPPRGARRRRRSLIGVGAGESSPDSSSSFSWPIMAGSGGASGSLGPPGIGSPLYSSGSSTSSPSTVTEPSSWWREVGRAELGGGASS